MRFRRVDIFSRVSRVPGAGAAGAAGAGAARALGAEGAEGGSGMFMPYFSGAVSVLRVLQAPNPAIPTASWVKPLELPVHLPPTDR